jgi:hypothetical protein
MQRQAAELERIKLEGNDRMMADEQKNLMFLVQKAAGIVKVGPDDSLLHVFFLNCHVCVCIVPVEHGFGRVSVNQFVFSYSLLT